MAAPDRFLGLDLGSRTTKIVELRAGAVERFEVFDTDAGSLARVRARLERKDYVRAAATGYGRFLMNAHLDCRVVTEITACALGARHLRPDAGMVIDIGGQDSKVILLGNGSGAFADFEMNDRCAAGTGRFLEVMARLLGFPIEEFGRAAGAAEETITLSSMCTVFAESEVISLLAAGRDRTSIALGLHGSIVDRVYPLAARFETRGEIVCAGGVALNPCLVGLLSAKLGRPVVVPDDPQIVTAVGAALAAADQDGVKPIPF
jgi:predicted CoA-substrate-specific enzyme activase